MQSLHCAITIIGGRQPARDGGVLANFPTFRLLDLSACWFFGVVADGGGSPLLLGAWKRGGEHGAGRGRSLGLAYRRGKEVASAQTGGQVRVRGKREGLQGV